MSVQGTFSLHQGIWHSHLQNSCQPCGGRKWSGGITAQLMTCKHSCPYSCQVATGSSHLSIKGQSCRALAEKLRLLTLAQCSGDGWPQPAGAAAQQCTKHLGITESRLGPEGVQTGSSGTEERSGDFCLQMGSPSVHTAETTGHQVSAGAHPGALPSHRRAVLPFSTQAPLTSIGLQRK